MHPPRKIPHIDPRHKLTGGMGDYTGSLAYRVMQANRSNAPMGPLNSPIIPNDPNPNYLADILDILKAMPWMIWNENRKQLMTPGRDALWFTAVLENVTIAAAGTETVATIVVPEGFGGAIEYIGTQVDPDTSFADLSWSLRVNGAVHPGFANLQMPSGTLDTPLPFRVELTQKTELDVIVNNTGAGSINASGIIIGWQELLNQSKDWGTSPESGIG